MKKISLIDVKKALKDSRFRLILPSEMSKEVDSFLDNPGCACHTPLFRKILRDCKEQLKKYYPDMDVPDEEEEIRKLAENNWSVMNCHVDELERKLRSLGPGRKQIAVARYEDQVTVVVNELDMVW
jgi:glycerophosphoryl diester phosphodiesterase